MQDYRTLRGIHHLHQAIQEYQAAYVLSNAKHIYFTAILINYAAALNLLDQASSNNNSRSQIIDLFKEARDVMERNDPRPPSYATVLSNLGQCYLDQYRETKVETDYYAALDTFRLAQTHHLSGSDPHPYLPASIGLATALWTGCEFHHSKNEISDLKKSIKYLDDVLERSAHDSDTQAECFKNLGSAHNLLFQKTKDPVDLDKSVEYNEKAIGSLRSYDPNLAATTFNLAQQYYTRYTVKRNAVDLGKAGESNKKARSLGVGNQELLKQIEELERHIFKQSRSFVETTKQQPPNSGDHWSAREAGKSSLSHGVHKPSRKKSDNWASSTGVENQDDRRQASTVSSQQPAEVKRPVHYRGSSRDLSQQH